ncbi:MAG: gliding motility lipoprotein GldH [Flavobacteriales bacterium]|nr:gliding motility lipoprotein GldH [Flavobacteriales bacterium]
MSFLIFCGCNEQPYYTKIHPIDNYEWNNKNILEFDFVVSDTLQPFNFYLHIRQEGDYSYQNLWTFLNTQGPDRSYRDTISFFLADQKGKWLGKSATGNLWENKILFKQNYRFKKIGNYTMTLEQAMRDSIIPHIADIGLIIERALDE